jgi:desampylase
MQVGMQMRISRALAAAIRDHAAECPDTEVCGLLFGTDEEIVAVQRTRNVAADPARAFEIDPAALIAAHRAARDGGAQVIGCYHSHPGGRAEPSATDRDQAAVGQVWIIIAGADVQAWRMDAVAPEAVELVEI